MPELSVVVPCYNEEEALPLFFQQVIPILDSLARGDWEIIVVDDGSDDGTWEIVRTNSERDSRVHGVSLSRNFGHQPALDAGLVFASGKYVAVCDCDLQDPPEVLARLVQRVREEGYDVCYAVRRRRDAPLILRFLYKAFYRLMSVFAEHPWPLDAGDFSALNHRALKAVLAMPEGVRMLRGLSSWIGLRQTYVTYDRPARVKGHSKYNLSGLLSLAIRAFVGFSQIPLRLASLIGLGAAAMSVVLGIFFVMNRLFPGIAPFGYYVGQNPGTTTIVILMLLIDGVLLLCIGIIGEYLAVIIREIKGRPAAIVKDTAGNPRPQDHRYSIVLLEGRRKSDG
jgi:dolichol-phosphate mannosyltransferase